MVKTHLNLDSMDENVAGYFLNLIQHFSRRHFEAEEIEALRSATGVSIIFSGGSLGQFKEELYVIYFKNFTRHLTPQVTLQVVVVSASTRHDDLIDRGDVIVAGTVLAGRFQMLSSSWATKTRNSAPNAYYLGERINDLFREAFDV